MLRLLVITAVVTTARLAIADPNPAPSIPPPYAYLPPGDTPVATTPHLDDDDRAILERGEISDARKTGGGVAAMFLGLGVGQAIQGRWLERGWMFAVTDLGAGALEAAGVIEIFSRGCNQACENRGAAILGAAAMLALGSRILQTWDAFSAPAAHNRRVRELRARHGSPAQPMVRVTPYASGSAFGFGVQL